MPLIPFNDNVQINAPKSLDVKYSKFVSGASMPFASIVEAQAAVPFYRSIGLTQLILRNGIPTEYWYRDGITDGNLIPKFPFFISEEVPVGIIDGFNPTFTLANVPLAGTVKLYKNGLRMTVISGDYTISGGIITMTGNIPQPEDILIADYQK